MYINMQIMYRYAHAFMTRSYMQIILYLSHKRMPVCKRVQFGPSRDPPLCAYQRFLVHARRYIKYRYANYSWVFIAYCPVRRPMLRPALIIALPHSIPSSLRIAKGIYVLFNPFSWVMCLSWCTVWLAIVLHWQHILLHPALNS